MLIDYIRSFKSHGDESRGDKSHPNIQFSHNKTRPFVICRWLVSNPLVNVTTTEKTRFALTIIIKFPKWLTFITAHKVFLDNSHQWHDLVTIKSQLTFSGRRLLCDTMLESHEIKYIDESYNETLTPQEKAHLNFYPLAT